MERAEAALEAVRRAREGERVDAPYLSVIVPVFNEAANLRPLFQRLTEALDAQGATYELIFTDDGSRDESLRVLLGLRQERPRQVRVIEFCRNFGQHMAVLAAFREVRGQIIVTLDADLQDPPEEISKLVSRIEMGHDLAGGYRINRKSGAFRRWASRAANTLRDRSTGLRLRDHGCMLRAYSRELVELIVQSNESITFIPALAALYARNPTEVPVENSARAAGESKYSLLRLIQLNFDLVTGFTAAPLQIFSLFGFLVSAFSGALVAVMAVRRLVVGPEVEGVFTLIGILFFLVGVCITGIGIMGEYLARIYQQVRGRPAYVIRRVHDVADSDP